ncbi:perlucin-like [Mizuhopecten yessoensis]|uniref:Perlucin n=1 Tax=Mizuhopecten yessoensis TaxID=6573 RepID=A0A210Q4E5_MIZYE|nr:perlucin-like [Mizuhopecten yessoensis]OWF43616.1 Perlucin [Mizuhopecten yessoensis]
MLHKMAAWMCVLLLLFVAITPEGCPLGWVQGPSSCFFFSQFGGTWADANAICKGFETKLAEPADEITFAFLAGHAASEHPLHSQFYLGGSDMFVEGVWEWSSTKTQVNPNHWEPGNPSDDNNNGDCLTLNAPLKELNDVQCTAIFAFICEAESGEPEQVVIG